MQKDEMKMIRDPLYGDIFASYNDIKLIDTKVIQRLKGVSQLGTLQWVYPGATHSRFEHSIGVLHLSTTIARQLLPQDEYDTKRDLLSASAIFHDAGHPPFSHSLEEHDLPLESHEKRSMELAKKTIESIPDVEISGREVADIMGGRKDYFSDIISGSLDADRLDYLRRDALHTGVTYGMIDTRILSLSRLWNSKLAISERAIIPGITVLFARYVMRAVVYDHKVSRSTGGMLAKAVEYAMTESDSNTHPISEEELVSLKDVDLLSRLRKCGDEPKDIVDKLERREILKLAGESDMKRLIRDGKIEIATQITKEQRTTWESELARQLKVKPYEVIIDKPRIKKYLIEEGEIPILSDGRSTKTLLDSNDLARQINEAHKFLWTIRLFVPEKHLSKARTLFKKVTTIKLYPPFKSPIKRSYTCW